MKQFNDNIKRIIDKFSYEFYIIQQDFNQKCSCVNFTTKEADPNCERCLGIGYKIKIKKITGASQDSKGTFKNNAVMESNWSKLFYIDSKFVVYQDNIIVDDDEILNLYRIEKKKTSNKEYVYTKGYAHNRKTNTDVFMKNFLKIVGK